MALTFIVTNAGRAALVNAANTGTAPVTITQVGLTATAVTPTLATAALPGEFKRLATLSGDVVADDTIHLIVRDESGDVFTVRSLAMYLADGTLFGIYGQASVLIEKSAQAMMLLGIDVKFEDIAATTITFGNANFLNPPATSERMGVVELSTLAETIAGLDTSRVPAEKMVKDAVAAWLDARFGANNSGIWHPANDGAGSGLDADLLDGQQGSYYSNITARLGYTPVQQGTGNGQLASNVVKIGWSGTRLKATVDVTDQGNFVFDATLAGGALDVNGATVRRGSNHLFGPDNDGSGSGLDADLLDGQDGSYYSNITARLGYTPANRAGDTFTGGIAAPTVFAGQVALPNSGANQAIIYMHETGGMTFSWNRQSAGNERFFSLWASGSMTFNGSNLWHAGNDGAGSGLDADLLDGQDGSYYGNITARLGYTPANKAGDTFLGSIAVVSGASIAVNAGANAGGIALTPGDTTHTGYLAVFQPNGTRLGYIGYATNGSRMGYVSENGTGHSFVGGLVYRDGNLLWDAANDGAGSGLDADLLDGQDSSYFTNIPARLGYTPVRIGGGVGQGSNFVYIGWAGTRLKATVDATDQGNFVFDGNLSGGILDVNGSTVRRAGNHLFGPDNDGSGSGLDADMVDGYQASDLAKYADFANNLSAAGYQRLPNGMIMQWCTTASQQNVETTASATFPIQFPNAVLDVQLTTRVDIASVEADTWYQLVGDPTTSGCTVMRARSDNDADRPTYCRIYAIGR